MFFFIKKQISSNRENSYTYSLVIQNAYNIYVLNLVSFLLFFGNQTKLFYKTTFKRKCSKNAFIIFSQKKKQNDFKNQKQVFSYTYIHIFYLKYFAKNYFFLPKSK